ncbi:MAG: hypothetical protein AB7P52_12355 [Alphaproteobacteria bacterium]
MRRFPLLALIAAILLNFCMGSLYGWSVLVAPLEESLGASRAAVSAVYSVALVSFTFGMFMGAAVMRLAAMPVMGLVIFAVGGVGLGLAGLVESYGTLMAGYGVLFAFAGGVNYFLCIAAASTDLKLRRSIALGIATASFALGGLVWPGILTPLLDALGPHGTLKVIAAVLLGAGLVGALLLWLSGARVASAAETGEGAFQNFFTERPRVVIAIWVGFVFLALGGLMAVSHAAGIAADYGVPAGEAYLGPMLFNLGYIGGALSAGFLSELFTGRRVLIGMGVLTAAPLFLLYAFPSGPMSLVALACVGAAFGAGTSCYPVTLVSYYGLPRMPAIFGRVCTGYGPAGLAAPFIAGRLHDMQGNYDLAVLIAAIVGVAGLLANAALPRRATLAPARA